MTTLDPIATQLAGALSGRYRIEGELGRGAMARVYLARDLRHDRAVALKLLPPEFATSEVVERFLREIRITAGLHHPNILPLLDSGAEAGLCWYVMPHVQGESLKDRLKGEPLSVRDALRITGQTAAALGYAHAQGIVHRDIKPGNVLLSGGQAMVMDFGLARALAAGSSRLTRTGMPLGTPAYMSPEQISGASEVGSVSDIYSLGCMLFEMVTGRPPFTGSVSQVLRAQLMDRPPPPSKVMQGLPRALDEVMDRLLAKEPNDRYQKAEELANDLEMLTALATLGEAQGAVDHGGKPVWKRWLGL